MRLDFLVIAPHPDDAELGAGGMLARAKAEGLSTGVLDLSRGELSSKGTPEIRQREAARAAEILRLDYRGNLGLPDGGLEACSAQITALAEKLRELKPKILLVPLEHDRHPDHLAASRLSHAAVYLAGLSKAGIEGNPHKTSSLLYYPGNYPATPNLLVDISDYIETWEAALRAYASQFEGQAASETVGPKGLEARRAQRRYWGNFHGVDYAEALVSPVPLLTTPWS